uniref:Uncharacterized protein n=1 Tax=Anguilla anguilla TaxID=7936 RepID=A0A0E9VYZ0_ANGAN
MLLYLFHNYLYCGMRVADHN